MKSARRRPHRKSSTKRRTKIYKKQRRPLSKRYNGRRRLSKLAGGLPAAGVPFQYEILDKMREYRPAIRELMLSGAVHIDGLRIRVDKIIATNTAYNAFLDTFNEMDERDIMNMYNEFISKPASNKLFTSFKTWNNQANQPYIVLQNPDQRLDRNSINRLFAYILVLESARIRNDDEYVQTIKDLFDWE